MGDAAAALSLSGVKENSRCCKNDLATCPSFYYTCLPSWLLPWIAESDGPQLRRDSAAFAAGALVSWQPLVVAVVPCVDVEAALVAPYQSVLLPVSAQHLFSLCKRKK